MLDASKAFYVVWHPGMLYSLHQLGVTGNLWRLYDDMYQGMTSQVKWGSEMSEPFVEGQGVRQGGIPSTELFKSKCNKLLTNLEESRQGYRIGLTSVAAPACADDIVLLSSTSLGLQTMLNIASTDASCERYQFSSTKSKVMILNSRRPNNAWRAGDWWKLADNVIDPSNKEKHLGLIREPIGSANGSVDENTKKSQTLCLFTDGNWYAWAKWCSPRSVYSAMECVCSPSTYLWPGNPQT